MKRKIPVICLTALLVVLVLAAAVYLFGGWRVTLTVPDGTVLTVEYGSELDLPQVKAFLSSKYLPQYGFVLPVKVDDAGLSGELGTHQVTYSAGILGFHAQAGLEVRLVDTTPPEITLVQDPDAYTRPIDAYQEEGFSALDLHDGNLTGQVSREERDGFVYYWVADSSGNQAEAVREIVYDDREAPVITLAGETVLEVEIGTEVPEPGYGAQDDCDGDLTAQVTRTQEGEVVRYSVTDSYGNQGTAERTIRFVDRTPPVITLSGDQELWMQAGQTFAEPGYSALDNGDGDVTEAVTVSGGVNPYHAGDYTLTYTVADAAGNCAEAVRTVHVEPIRQPDKVEPDGKVIYLTFDDGPGAYTEQLLDVLAEYNVKATFFVTGANEDYQWLIGKASKEGHGIGLHTYSHKYESIYASEDAYFDDLNQMQAIVEKQTGCKTTMIRFPGGSSNTVSGFNAGIMTRLAQDVTDMGYQYYDWNVLSGDAGETTDTETVAQNVIDGVSKHRVSIVLQHDIKAFSVDAVEKIVVWGLSNDYTFLPLTPESPTAHHGINN